MPKVINKQSCPTCGQSANKREIAPNSQDVSTLLAIYKFCLEKNRHEFKRDEFDHLIPRGHSYGNFAYWKWFGAGLVYTPVGLGKGYWGFNLERIAEFFKGKRQIYARIWNDPLQPTGAQRTEGEMVYIHEIRNIKTFIDENREWIVQYIGEAPSTLGLRMQPKRRRLKKGQEPCPRCGEALVNKMETSAGSEPNTLKMTRWKQCPTCKYETEKI